MLMATPLYELRGNFYRLLKVGCATVQLRRTIFERMLACLPPPTDVLRGSYKYAYTAVADLLFRRPIGTSVTQDVLNQRAKTDFLRFGAAL
jgi:hypothetical protein